MPKTQLTDAKIVKFPTKTYIITTLIITIGTLFVAIISLFWESIIFENWTGTPTPAIELTTLPRDWYVVFELKFPVNYWTEGVHSLSFEANCPVDINSISENGPTNSFSVDRTAVIQQTTVFIRRRGLYLTEIKGDAFGHFIHPSQETAAIYSLFTLSFEDAKRLQDECKVFVKFDNGFLKKLPATRIGKIQ